MKRINLIAILIAMIVLSACAATPPTSQTQRLAACSAAGGTMGYTGSIYRCLPASPFNENSLAVIVPTEKHVGPRERN